MRYALEGSTVWVSWDPVEGADYYNLYHHDFFDSGCTLNIDGRPLLCEALATNVVGTSYVPTDPDIADDYFWVSACNQGGCSEIDSENPAERRETSAAGPTEAPTESRQLEFTEGDSTTRSIPENTPGGVNLGGPISAEGGGAVTYAMSGTDAASFGIVPATGQVRTKDGVVYDYETKNRYEMTVDATDRNGRTGAIEVIVHIENLVPACRPVLNLRTGHGDGFVAVKWTPALQREGNATVLGYQVEMRPGDDGPWTARRTVLGRSIASTVYGSLENLASYWFRIRPINTESDCGWSPPFLGIPATYTSPIYPIDRFDTQPVGEPDRYWRFVTTDRCRFRADGVTLDANCRYLNTGPHTSRIVLEFDDPSRGSCEIALAFSSLTAGSFVDDCLDAGVNTETPFDTSFRMPTSGPQPVGDVAVPRSPRSREEFEVLAWGRDDFIPGLIFGCPPIVSHCEFNPGQAWRVERDQDTGLPHYVDGEYTYENTGPSQGRLMFRTVEGDDYVFTLDFAPSGNMRVTITDGEGESAAWPGMPYPDLELGAQPVLLPIPPSWSAAIAVESDIAPDDIFDLEDRIPGESRSALLERTLLGDVWDRAKENDEGLLLLHDISYRKIGRNRGLVSIPWTAIDEEYLSEFQKELVGSTWTFDLTFTSDGAATYTLTITKEGRLPVVKRGFVDFNGDSINLNEFPDELLPPVSPPQAAGEDYAGVEVAAAISTSEISGSDVQTFLIRDQGVQSASYEPGDWLEPKDGSNQRMMIVGAGPAAAAHDPSSSPSADLAEPTTFHRRATFQPMRFALFIAGAPYDRLVVSAVQAVVFDPAFTQLSVVCMQKDHGIPTRGARYFSQPKTSEGPVQACQKNCVLNESSNIQECVWKCEEN